MDEDDDVPPSIKGFIAHIERGINKKPDIDDSVCAHYGVSHRQFGKWQRDVFVSLIDRALITETIDDTFPELSSEQRCKVFAFHAGMTEYKRAKPMLHRADCDCDDEDEEES